MAISFQRAVDSNEYILRITADVLGQSSLSEFVSEMEKVTREFVQTDPEVRILVNEMVRTAFQQVDLLKLVTDVIRTGLLDTKCGLLKVVNPSVEEVPHD